MLVPIRDDNIRMEKRSVLSGYIGQPYAVANIAGVVALDVVAHLKLARFRGLNFD